MISSISASFGILALAILCYTCACLYSLRRNIAAAASSGLKYVVLPCSLLGTPWLLTQSFLIPLLTRLPSRWTERWFPLLLFNRGWHDGYEPFERMGTDAFLAVSPGGIILYTCDPEASSQLFRDPAFGKPAELMGILNVFGPTMTGMDGPESRLYRRIAGPFFTEQTLRKVWTQSVVGAEALLEVLVRPDAHERLRSTVARLTLHLLNEVCFETDPDYARELQFQEEVPSRHELSYSQAMHSMLDHFATVFVMPSPLLKLSPFEAHKQASLAYNELGQYMRELKLRKENDGGEAEKGSGSPSLLDLLVAAGLPSPTSRHPLLTPRAVLGNIFIFMFAGHEANANTLTFIILLLACHPRIQAALQRDLDALLAAARPPHAWSYDADYAPLMRSMLGAVVNEALRLFTVLPFLPKCVPRGGPPVPLVVAGRPHRVPAGTLVLVNTSAAHRHPRYWPLRDDGAGRADHRKEEKEEEEEEEYSVEGAKPHPVRAFDPERWRPSVPSGSTRSRDDADSEGDGSEGEHQHQHQQPAVENEDEGQGFLRPQLGTYMPFSEGSRGCLGRRFALVELCAVVATLFRTHSVELIVDDDGDDEHARRRAWKKARAQAEWCLSEGVKFDMSLRVTVDVPVRFVRRGEERFAGDVHR